MTKELYIHGCTPVEAEGMALILELMRSYHPEAVIREVKGNTDCGRHLQETCGDILMVRPGVDFEFVEVKIETRWTGNFFFETWSNFTPEPQRLNAGGFIKTRAHYLCYAFLDTKIAYLMERKRAVEIILRDPSKYREVSQTKHAQKNHTRGLLVPVDGLVRALSAEGSRVRRLSLAGLGDGGTRSPYSPGTLDPVPMA